MLFRSVLNTVHENVRGSPKNICSVEKSSESLEIYSIYYTDLKASYISQNTEMINLNLLTVSRLRREESNISPVFYHTMIRMAF